MKPVLTLVQIAIEAGSIIPSGAHRRTLKPSKVQFAANPGDQSLRLQIDAAGPWTSVEPITLGPEKALWDNLHGAKILHTDKYPSIKFTGHYAGLTAASVNVEGQLTVRDKSVPIGFTASGQTANGTVTYSGQIPIKLSQLGIAKFKAMLGTLWLEDRATLAVAVQVPVSELGLP